MCAGWDHPGHVNLGGHLKAPSSMHGGDWSEVLLNDTLVQLQGDGGGGPRHQDN